MFRPTRPLFIVTLSVLFAGVMVAFSLAQEDASPPAATHGAHAAPTTKPAEITADAKPLLEKLSSAYKDLKSFELASVLSGEFDVDGQKSSEKIEMTSSFAAPNRFRHEVKDALLVGSTGEQLYILENSRKLYKTAEAAKEKTSVTALPDPFDRILIDQNLSLALAMSNDPAADLGKMYEKIDKAPDVDIDGKKHPALSLSNEHETVTLAIDPQTNLIRRASSDITKSVKKRGAQDVTKAHITMDYPTSTPGAATKPERFAWTPPAGARDVATLQAGEGDNPAMAMVGKPAPDFALKDLSDKDVKLSALKGNVIVLDFWATWCPPCIASMPGLDKLAGELKDQGLKVLAVNQEEEKELVQGFINSRGLNNLHVVLDTDSKVGNDYMITGLPTTMVVGKDGTVRKVMTGVGSQTERELRAAVEEALRASK